MLTKLIKSIMVVSLLLGSLLFILGCAGTNMMTPQKQRYPQEAQRSVVITIDTSYRQEFFDQLQKFADEHDFTIQIDAQPSGAEDFLIYMTRGDIEISGANVFSPGEYQLGVYHADLLHPAPDSAFDDLINDLKRFVIEVPGAIFSVEK